MKLSTEKLHYRNFNWPYFCIELFLRHIFVFSVSTSRRLMSLHRAWTTCTRFKVFHLISPTTGAQNPGPTNSQPNIFDTAQWESKLNTSRCLCWLLVEGGTHACLCVFQFDRRICKLFSKCRMRRLRLWDPSIFSWIALSDPVVSSGRNDCGFRKDRGGRASGGPGRSSETDAERRLCFALETLQPHFQTPQPRRWDS